MWGPLAKIIKNSKMMPADYYTKFGALLSAGFVHLHRSRACEVSPVYLITSGDAGTILFLHFYPQGVSGPRRRDSLYKMNHLGRV